ncbi:MAG: diacylglycerol/lipid kinase family protein [Bilifractor sp.]|nr:YegS/Rv2252/BmrU family lipid kinase [Lachnospiraceae bacterium]
MKKLLFIYNPKAGRGMVRLAVPDIIDIFTRGGYDVIAHPTQAVGDATKVVLENGEDVDAVVCGGGDGTFDEVLNGVMVACPDIKVGYIPCGSTNDFARSLAIATDPIEAAQDIVVGDVYQCDAGKFNNRYFSYVAAFGMFTNVSYETDQNLKNTLGHLAYLIEAGRQMFNIPSYHLMVDIDGVKVEGNYTVGMVTNSRLVGGMKNITGTNVDMNDGLLEVTLVRTPTNPVDMHNIIAELTNSDTQLGSHIMVDKFKGRRIAIEAPDNIAWTLDGEYGDTVRNVLITDCNKVLNLFLNRRKPVKLVNPSDAVN